jgi:hypothetical protein
LATIEFRSLSVQDAEQVLAEIWNCLEEFDIRSPRLVVKFGGQSEVTLRCRFDEQLSARIVAMRLSRWLAGNERRGIALECNPEVVLFPFFSGEPQIARQRERYSEAVFLRHMPTDRPQ